MEKVNNKEQNGGIFNTLDEYAESYEPAAAALSLGGLGVGIATSATGAPIGSAIAIASQIPSTVIDGYQAVRDWYKTAKGNNNLGSALWNTAETGLDLAGAKATKTLAKGVTGLVEPHVFNPRKPIFHQGNALLIIIESHGNMRNPKELQLPQKNQLKKEYDQARVTILIRN